MPPKTLIMSAIKCVNIIIFMVGMKYLHIITYVYIMTTQITVENFDQEVLKTDKLVILDFWAPWCGPCKMLGPIMDQLGEEHSEKAVIGKINIDEQRALAEKFGVMSIPTVYAIKDGKVVDKSVGVRPKKYYSDLIG